MAIPIKQPRRQKRPGRKLSPKEQLARLRSQVSRLRSEIKALRARGIPASEPGRAETGHTPAAQPVLPPPDADGNYPAAESIRVILAQQIIRRREAAGWSQKDLAARAGVRQETISRLETARHAATVTTVDKLDRALKAAGF